MDTTITLVETGRGRETAVFFGGVFFGFDATPWSGLETLVWYCKQQGIAPALWEVK